MSRWEFMRQLEELLSDISPSEKEEALQYYNDYFNDAGRENEQEVIKALGSPAQVAEIVRDGLSENAGSGEFTESGFKNAASSQENPIIKRESESAWEKKAGAESDEKTDAGSGESGKSSGNYENGQRDGFGKNQSGAYKASWSEGRQGTGPDNAGTYTGEVKGGFPEKKEGLPVWAIVLIIIGCIFLAPAILGGIGGIIGSLLGIVGGIAALVLGIGAAAFVLYFSAVLLVVVGIGYIFVAPVKGIGLLGAGFVCGALGILCMLLTYFLVWKAFPAIWRGIKYVYKMVSDKIGGMRR